MHMRKVQKVLCIDTIITKYFSLSKLNKIPLDNLLYIQQEELM